LTWAGQGFLTKPKERPESLTQPPTTINSQQQHLGTSSLEFKAKNSRSSIKKVFVREISPLTNFGHKRILISFYM
jgi:hypothetical protein